MILLKFIGWVFVTIFCLILFLRIFGKPLLRLFARYVVKKAQQDMERQQQVYNNYVKNHSPFEDNVYVNEDTRVSIRRGKKQEAAQKQTAIDESFIEEVEFEDFD